VVTRPDGGRAKRRKGKKKLKHSVWKGKEKGNRLKRRPLNNATTGNHRIGGPEKKGSFST